MDKKLISFITGISRLNYYLAFVMIGVVIIGTIILPFFPSLSESDAFSVTYSDLPLHVDYSEVGTYNDEQALVKIKSNEAVLSFNNFSALTYVVAFFAMMGAFIYLLGSRYFFRLMKNVKKGEVFNLFNAKKIQSIGVLMLVWWGINIISSIVYVYFFSNAFKFDSLEITPNISIELNYLFVALLIMAIASIFKHGVELEEEKKLTI